jgi:hypothetical protein
MDKLEKAGDSFLTGVMALTFLFLVFVVVSNQEYKEAVAEEKKPKHPMEGVVKKACIKVGMDCPMMANHGEWGR